MASNSGRVVKSRYSESHSMPFDCQRTGNTEHSYSLNSLWSIWYCTLAMAFQVYIIANSIKRFTLYLSLPWPNGQPPFSSLNAYVVLIGTGVVMLPFFVVVSMMKIGNYSNDGHKLGNQRKAYETSVNNIYQNIRITEKEMRRKRRFHGLKLIWRHSAPIAPFLHMLAALCFLIPRVLMEAQLIKHGFLGKGDIWKTEIDLILNRLDDKKISILSFLNTISDSERNQLNLETYSLNQYLTKQSSNLVKHYDLHIEESGHLSLELINFGIALFVLAVRYPSVFWKVHKGFGFGFSIQLIINLIQSLLIYSAFQVALKVLVCDPNLVLVRFKSASNLTPFRLTFIFISYIILLTTSSSPLYMYGLQKYREWRSSQSRRQHITLVHKKQRFCGYFAHFCAFIVLIALSVNVCPLFYQFVIIYCGSLDSSLLIAIFSTTIHLLLWIIVWLCLTIKNKWRFNVTFDYNDYENKYNFNDKYDRKSMPYARGETPLLVIENGKTYQIRETASKRAILGVAQRSRITQNPISPTEDEDIYWLRPKLSTPNKVLNKQSPEEDSSMTWLKNDKKSNNKVSFEDGNNTGGKAKKKNRKSPKSTLKSKKNKTNENGIDLDYMSDHSDGDYATLRRIITNDIENRDLTHLSLCPLRNESIELKKTQMNPTLDGDYELLVENTYSTAPQNRNTNNQMTNETPITVYSTNVCQTMSSTPLTVAAHFGREEHITDQLTPRSGSISETSTSPEKNSDTSSGVHSNSSNGANSTPPPSSLMMDKRSSSMESLMNQIQAAAAAKPSFRSLSLQRYMSSLPTEQIHNTIPQRMSSFTEADQTMVIRRAKRPQRTSDIFNMNGTGITRNDNYFGRDTNFRMTSFTENPEYIKFHSMPTQPKMVPIPAVPTTKTCFNSNEYSQTFTDLKPYLTNSLNSHVITGIQRPVVSIAPQVMAVNGSPNFLQQSLQPREQTNYSFASQSNPTAPASQQQTT